MTSPGLSATAQHLQDPFFHLKLTRCHQPGLLQGPADLREDWVKELHQLELRTKGIRSDRDQKRGLRARWEQLSGNQNVHGMKVEAKESPKWKLQQTSSTSAAVALQMEMTFLCKTALE